MKRTQISGSAPTQRQSWTNSSRPALPGSSPPQQVVNGTRLAGSPIVAVQSKPSVVLPPKRMMPGLSALSGLGHVAPPAEDVVGRHQRDLVDPERARPAERDRQRGVGVGVGGRRASPRIAATARSGWNSAAA